MSDIPEVLDHAGGPLARSGFFALPCEVIDVRLPDGYLSAVRRYPREGAPRLLFCHGSGLASDSFAPFWLKLIDRFEVVVMDLRGHGRNAPVGTDFAIEALTDDLKAVIAALSARLPPAPLVGVFHSIAGVFGLRTAIDLPDAFAALVLFEPAFVPPQPGENYGVITDRVITSTLRRRSRFSSVRDFGERLLTLPPTANMPPESAMALAEGLLREDGDEFRLRCDPATEAQLYATNNDLGMWESAGPQGVPVVIQTGAVPSEAANYSAGFAPKLAARWSLDMTCAGPQSHFGWLVEPSLWAGLTAGYVEGILSR